MESPETLIDDELLLAPEPEFELDLFVDDDPEVLRAALELIDACEVSDSSKSPDSDADSLRLSPLPSTPPITQAEPTPDAPESRRTYTRRKQEIAKLRALVADLEQQLGGRKRKTLLPESLSFALGEDLALTPDINVVWERISQRQQQQRQLAELENIKLQNMVQDQLHIARELTGVAKRRALVEGRALAQDRAKGEGGDVQKTNALPLMVRIYPTRRVGVTNPLSGADAPLSQSPDDRAIASSDPSKCSRSRQEQKRQLVAQVDERELWLDTLQWIQADDDAAARERTKHDDAVRTNALLRQAVTDHRALAKQVGLMLQRAHHTLGISVIPRGQYLYSLPLRVSVPPILAQQLDAVYFHVLSLCDVNLPYTPQDTKQWTSTTDVVQYNVHRTLRYPFNLVPVASELWKMLHETSLDQVPWRLDDDETTSNFVLRVHKPYGRVKINGPSVRRRTFLPDGSVLLTLVALSIGPPIEGNLMAGFQQLEVTWMRIMHNDRGNVRSGVVIEMAHQYTARVDSMTPQTTDVTSRLQRLQAFAQRSNDEDGPRTQQTLENRLITANLADRPTSL